MEKKAVIIGSIIVLLAGAISLLIWRAHVMGPGARSTPGGLLAISIDRTPMPVPIAQGAAVYLPENTAIQESGGLLVSLALDPYPPTVSKPGNFEIKLTDQDGQANSNAIISLDLTMPGMYMPPNQLKMESAGEGKYLATGHYTMRGLWRIEVILSLGGKTQSVFFEVWL
jgi:hypothetical protein